MIEGRRAFVYYLVTLAIGWKLFRAPTDVLAGSR
jgi:hypothetical protein